jgi:uncharacterized protein YjbI with pentapeptide repeats
MKGKRFLLVGLAVGIVIGWALGFLRLPYLEKNVSFLLGFVAALAVVAVVLLLLTARNRNFPGALTDRKTLAEDPAKPPAHTPFWTIPLGVLVVGGIVGGVTVHRHHESLNHRIQDRDKQLREMAALMEAMKPNDREPLIKAILQDVGEELKRHPGRKLRDTTIARIAALSFACTPYRYIQGDSLSEKAYSPERGQLLQALILLNLDPGSFAGIKRKTLFAGADLRGADLKGLDLSGINLREANLDGADLTGANLDSAGLGEANLWEANLNRANLRRADLKRADLSWAQLNEANLRQANLNGAILASAQLRKADLQGATFQWAQLGGALFHEAKLTGADFTGANLSKVNLSQADLSQTDLRRINFSQADLVGAVLNQALVDKDWLDKLTVWQPTGANELRANYSVVNDTADKFKTPLFRLKKI